ncbi:MAG: sulfurtransferase TusA family protein [Chlorobiaceae bacterium]|nr:sulfurtransferase TusA family protein [Chlorobiaceae bacterium]
MSQSYSISGSIDVTGVSCPANALRVKQAVSGLSGEELIEVVVDEGQSLINVVRSINDAGFRIFKSEQRENSVAIIVGRRKQNR